MCETWPSRINKHDSPGQWALEMGSYILVSQSYPTLLSIQPFGDTAQRSLWSSSPTFLYQSKLCTLPVPISYGGNTNPSADTSAKIISTQVEWLCQSGRAPSESSETLWWRITPRPASKPRVALHIALPSPGNVSSRSFYVMLEERRNQVRRYDTTQPWGTTQLRKSTKSRKERVRPKVEIDWVCIFVVWQDKMKMICCLSTPGFPQ